LLIVFYGHGTWSLILREESSLMAFENTALTGCNRDREKTV